MFFTPFHCLLSPKLSLCILTQSRLIRTALRIGKDGFRLTISVHNFRIEEIRIKADTDHIKIEGKQERESDSGFVIRKFVKRYKLPPGCDPKEMRAELSSDGALTISGVRHPRELFPCETLIPIKYGGTRVPDDETFVSVCDGPCNKWKK